MPMGSLKIRTQWVVFAALRNEPSLAVADCLVKTKPTADSRALTQNAIGEF